MKGACGVRHIGWTLVALGLVATPLAAQGKGPKKYAVTTDRALVVTKDVLVQRGYEVVRAENSGRDVVVWYRRGDRGRGKGKGPPARVGVDRCADRVGSVSAV